jgi:hypothetical protein
MAELNEEIQAATAWLKKYGDPTYVETVNLE